MRASGGSIVDGAIDPVPSTGRRPSRGSLLPPEPWREGTWGEGPWGEGDLGRGRLGEWTQAVKTSTGAKGKALFMPLRLALTGLDHGPELKALCR